MTTTQTGWTVGTLAEALGIRAEDIAGAGGPDRGLPEAEAAKVIEGYAIKVTANVIDGVLDLDTNGLLDGDDTRWHIIQCPVTRGTIGQIQVGPWAVDEEGMTRADQGLAVEGLTRVGAWVDDEVTGAPTTWVVRRSDREVRGWVPYLVPDRLDALLVLDTQSDLWVRRGAPTGAGKAQADWDTLNEAAKTVAQLGTAADMPSRGWSRWPACARDPWAGTRLALVRAFMPGVSL